MKFRFQCLSHVFRDSETHWFSIISGSYARQQHSWEVGTRTICPVKPNTFTLWLLTAKVCQSLPWSGRLRKKLTRPKSLVICSLRVSLEDLVTNFWRMEWDPSRKGHSRKNIGCQTAESGKILGGIISTLSSFVWNDAKVISSPLWCSSRAHKTALLAIIANFP